MVLGPANSILIDLTISPSPPSVWALAVGSTNNETARIAMRAREAVADVNKALKVRVRMVIVLKIGNFDWDS
jgi:hypothetical protein